MNTLAHKQCEIRHCVNNYDLILQKWCCNLLVNTLAHKERIFINTLAYKQCEIKYCVNNYNLILPQGCCNLNLIKNSVLMRLDNKTQ